MMKDTARATRAWPLDNPEKQGFCIRCGADLPRLAAHCPGCGLRTGAMLGHRRSVFLTWVTSAFLVGLGLGVGFGIAAADILKGDDVADTL